MKKTAIILTTVAIFLLVSINAFAAEDFTAKAPGAIRAIQCAEYSKNITITNTGTTTSTYALTAQGGAKKWISFSPDTFTLAPGQTKAVREKISVPCNANAETEAYVVISTDFTEKAITQKILASKTTNIELVPEVYSQKINPCGKAEFKITLKNPSIFEETYALSIKNSPENTTLSDQSITLKAGENKTITITTRPDNCHQHGSFSPVFTAKTQKTKLTAELDLKLEITRKGIAELSKIKRIKTGPEPSTTQLSITNKGDGTAEYIIKADGIEWASTSPEHLSVGAGETKTFNITFKPTNETKRGNYQLTILATPKETNATYQTTTIVSLVRPTLIDKLFTTYLAYTLITIGILIFSAIMLWMIFTTLKSEEYIKRKQEKASEKEKQQRLRAEQQKLEEKQREELKRIEEEAQKKGAKLREEEIKQKFKLIAKDEIVAGEKTQGKWLLKTALLLIILFALALAIGLHNILATGWKYAIAGLAVLSAIILTHLAGKRYKKTKKTPFVLANQKLTINGWKKGVMSAELKLNTPVKKLCTTISKNTRGLPQASQHTYQQFSITTNTDPSLVETATIRFSVKKSWLSKRNIAPSDVRLKKFVGEEWTSVGTKIVSQDDEYVYYSAQPDSIGTFAITGTQRRPARKKPSKATGIILLSFIALIGIALLALNIQLPSSQHKNAKGIPPQVWPQNTIHSIDLSKYFSDPDNETLKFSASTVKNIDVFITGSIAQLTPERDWTGTTSIVFFAEDSAGERAISNNVQLTVTKPLIPENYKLYINYGLAGLALLFAILFALQIKPFSQNKDKE